MQRLIALALAASMICVLPVLAQDEEGTGAQLQTDTEAPAVQQPGDWREELGVFRIGIVSGGDIEGTVARGEPFRLALAEALKMRVDLFPARDFSALIDAAADSRIEYAVFSASAYALAWSLCECLEPLAVARSGDGATGYRQILFARAGAIASIAALEGKRIAVVETQTAGGGLLALRELREAGLDLEGGEAKAVSFSTGEGALEALTAGEVDAMIGWSSLHGDKTLGYSRGTLQRLSRFEESPEEYTIIWQSSPIPHRTHAIRKNLPAEAKTILRSSLISMFDADPVAYDSIEPVFGGGFVASRQAEYQSLVELMRARGVKAAE